MSGEAIITFIAVAVILVVFGIPLYVVRRRNRIQVEEPEQEQPSVDVTPVNDAGPQLTQEPAITSAPIAVDPNPVPPVQPARRRVEKKATVAPVVEKKSTRRSKPKPDLPSKALKKALKEMAVKEVASMDKNAPVLSNEFALKHGLKLDEKKTKTTKKTTKSTKTAKKSTPKSKKSK